MIILAQQFKKQKWRILLALLMIGLLAVALVQPVYAAEFRDGDTVIIGEDEVIDDDLFISGQTVTVDGTVTGNLFAAGANVTVNGVVDGSLFMAGQSLAVNGTVNGSLFGTGYSLTTGPDAVTDGNLYFSGFSLTTEPGSQVGRSLYGNGYQLLLDGTTADNVYVGAAALELTGNVGGDVTGSVSSSQESAPTMFMPSFDGSVSIVPPGLRMDDSAQVSGDVTVDVIQPDQGEAAAPVYSLANERTRWVLGELIALLIVGFLLLWLRPTWLRRTSAVARERWLPSLGVGLLAVIIAAFLVPLIVGIIVLLTIAGGWISLGELTAPILGLGLTGLGLAVAVFLFLVGMVSKIIVAFLGGRLLVQRPSDSNITARDFAALALGLVIYILLRALPFGVGFIIGLFITLLGLGAFFLTWRRASLMQTTSKPAVQKRPQESLAQS